MSITVTGVPNSINAQQWSELLWNMGIARSGMAIPDRLAVTPATGTRAVSVQPGASLQAGTLATSNATTTLSLAANTSTSPRIDTVVMQINWSGTTSANAGSIIAVQGVAAANPVPPALTQTPGVLWQTPLANVTVPAGAATITTVQDYRPWMGERTCSGTVALSSADTTGTPVTQSVTFPPGYFRNAPQVTLTPRTGITLTTQFAYWVSATTAANFSVTMSRTTTTQVTFSWIASGT